MKGNVFWKGMGEDVKIFVRECDICQRQKYESTSPAGLLEPLEIPQRVWEDVAMDFIDGLPKSGGKTVILVVVDRLSKYAHFMALAHPYTAESVAGVFMKEVIRLHGLPKSIVSDRDPIFISKFWKELFKMQGTQLKMSTANHPQTDGQTEVLNRGVETYLRCFAMERPHRWQSWLAWAEYCYNTSYQTAAKLTPFQILYGRPPPTLGSYEEGSTDLPQVEKMLQEREETLSQLRENLQKAQERMKLLADKHRTERSFLVGDLVFLKLQPYRQMTVARRGNQKLAPRYYGPFEVLKRVGPVAYTLRLPEGARIHPTFHVSLLKRKVGITTRVETTLPEVTQHGEIHPIPEEILFYKWKQRHGEYRQEALVKWKGMSEAHNTWVDCEALHQQYPDLRLEDKSSFEEKGNDVNGMRDPLIERSNRRKKRVRKEDGTEPPIRLTGRLGWTDRSSFGRGRSTPTPPINTVKEEFECK